MLGLVALVGLAFLLSWVPAIWRAGLQWIDRWARS
jgi:hypothetical protein